MIFVSVGSQQPFDRLVQGMDNWTKRHNNEQVFAQIGKSALTPCYMKFAQTLPSENFHQKFLDADLIVSHAGMGNVLLALELNKPLILMPRRSDLAETRNDHQIATVKWLQEKYGFEVVLDSDGLDQAIQKTRGHAAKGMASPFASQELIDAIRNFINQE